VTTESGPKPTTERLAIHGVAAAAGVVVGPWARLDRPALPAPRTVEPAALDEEIELLRGAADAVAASSTELAARVRAAGHTAEAEIFAAHAEMARDPELLESAIAEIRTRHVDAVAAIGQAADVVASLLRSLDDDLLRARATDVIDVGDRIARRVAGLPAEPTLAEPAIVVAEDLPPSVTATLPRERLRGIVLERSSPTAHAAILARAYGIPAVVGAGGVLASLAAAGPAATVALDGGTGEVVVAPSADDLARFEAASAQVRDVRQRDADEADLPAVTRDGTEVTLLANIGSPAESAAAVALGARGVGLFRTEFLFMERATAPSEDEQADAYGEVAAAFAPHPVTIRLLDVGGDKPLPYLPIPREDNPFLGVRALRLASTWPDLFVTQLRACYRAAARGSVKVMAPMVADGRDVDVLMELAARARAEAAGAGQTIGEIDLGVMLEIPSAVLVADSYFDRIRFASLGTNDLLQYTLAVDRGNEALEGYRDSLHPGVLRLIGLAADAARRAGIELSVCGEMAGDPVAALALVGLGVRSLSMAAPSLPAVRRTIRSSTLVELESAAASALMEASAGTVRARFGAMLTP
jgi:phosphoenolpyruvate-protein phosphotransferase